jgi:hypothetical protein
LQHRNASPMLQTIKTVICLFLKVEKLSNSKE